MHVPRDLNEAMHCVAGSIAVCERKKAYPTRGAAIKNAWWLGRELGGEQVPYQCPVCAEWHLTTKERA